jgi:hypothetical protein
VLVRCDEMYIYNEVPCLTQTLVGQGTWVYKKNFLSMLSTLLTLSNFVCYWTDCWLQKKLFTE